ncbi:MAG TPA: NUDIX domain-containing protein [Woeseiaceae bacterium]|nr:NUDIX domain-containing protein [Woeseiaceae bacterium]
MAYTYEHPHPAVTVDVAVFTITAGRLAVVLVRRAAWPHAGKWALPGGFVGIDESLKRAAFRELREETGLRAGYLEQLGAFGRPDRDPRERVVTVVYIALASAERIELQAGSDAKEARLFRLDELPELAFDHARIVRLAAGRLRERLDTEGVARRLMPQRFTLTELQQACEAVAGTHFDKRNFRKKLTTLELLEPTGEARSDGPQRPARLYRVKPQ